MNFQARTSPSLRSMDRNQRVIYVGSFLKDTLTRHSYRLHGGPSGYHSRGAGGARHHVSPSTQSDTGNPRPVHTPWVLRCSFAQSRTALQAALAIHAQRQYQPIFDMLNQYDNEGGTSFWLTGPDNFDASLLRTRLRERGVLIDRGQTYYPEPEPQQRLAPWLRLRARREDGCRRSA